MRLAVDIDGTLNDADTWALVLAKRFAKKHGIKMKLNLEAFDYSDKFFGGDKKAESLFLKECGFERMWRCLCGRYSNESKC